MPTVETDPSKLEEHVHWKVFDESPTVASIPEIGYAGVCKYFKDQATQPERMTRSSKRMAEFLVHDAVPLDKILCVVAKTDGMKDTLHAMMTDSAWDIPVYTMSWCFYG